MKFAIIVLRHSIHELVLAILIVDCNKINACWFDAANELFEISKTLR